MQVDPRLAELPYRVVLGVMVGLGSACVAAGAALALYAGWIVYLLMEEPKRVPLVSYLIDLSLKSMRAAHGSSNGKPFDIELGEPIFWFLFLFAGVLLLGIVASVAKTLVGVGVDLITRALAEMRRGSAPPGT